MADFDPHACDSPSRASHAAPASALAPFVSGYTDYWERTGALTRREMPGLQSVLIVNLGAPIRITGGDGNILRLGLAKGSSPACTTATRYPTAMAARPAFMSGSPSAASNSFSGPRPAPWQTGG